MNPLVTCRVRFAIAAVTAALAGCSPRPEVFAVYSGTTRTETRQLVRLDYDSDGDGFIDSRTYMRQGRPARLEGDANRDGVIDRWEYYDGFGRLTRTGGSTRNDGREDMWVWQGGDEARIDYSSRRDGGIDRRDFFRGDALTRTERDTNADGLADEWEYFERGRLTMVMFDEEKHSGRPTRRLVYEAGRARVEVDPDGDGHFVPAQDGHGSH